MVESLISLALVAPVRSAAGEPVSPWAPTEVNRVIEAKCASDWPDYRMRQACDRDQRQAVERLKEPNLGIDVRRGEAIRAACAQEWPESFTMRVACERYKIQRAGGQPPPGASCSA